ncbi:MAG: transcriptional regulator GcvA [Pseudomonadota bacterium]
MADRLPPLTALRAFEAAARHMSFAKAAKELFVTPAALSYQIKQLEDHLGVAVFRRMNRAVDLTDEGQALLPGVRDGFDNLRQAIRAVNKLKDEATLTITAGPAFTAKWLAPRFFRFADDHPEFELRFVASLRAMDFDIDGVDAAIRFGTEPDIRYYSEVLSDEWLTPVCAPQMVTAFAGEQGIDTAHLLHDESLDFMENVPNWPAWAAAAGMSGDFTHGARFTNADHAIDVALEGGGIALGRVVLVARYLENNRLIAPFPMALHTGGQYRFVCPKGHETKPRLATLLAWLREEISDVPRVMENRDVTHMGGRLG